MNVTKPRNTETTLIEVTHQELCLLVTALHTHKQGNRMVTFEEPSRVKDQLRKDADAAEKMAEQLERFA